MGNEEDCLPIIHPKLEQEALHNRANQGIEGPEGLIQEEDILVEE